MFTNLAQDLRFAFRTYRRAPVFSAVVVTTLAIGIGAVLAVFPVVDGVLLKPLDYPESGRLVHLRGQEAARWGITYPAFRSYRENARGLESAVAWQGWSVVLEGRDGESSRLLGASVSHEYFDVLGAEPALGRFFVEAEGEPNHAPVVVLSHDVWRDRFGGDPGVIGRTVEVEGAAYAVVGVAPASFEDPVTAMLEWPRFRDALVREVRPTLLALFAAVVAVLLIGCANVANLLLSRAAAREREIAVRTSLGAGRGRLARPLTTESVALAAVGGVLAVPLGIAGSRVLLALADARLPRAEEVAAAVTPVASAGLLARTVWEPQSIDPGFDPESALTMQVRLPTERFPAAGAQSAALAAVRDEVAAIGTAGAPAYTVAQRLREIGVRMALGAEPGRIVRLIVGQSTRLAALGVGIGLAGAFAVSRLIAGFLYGIPAGDPLVFEATALLLLAVAIAAGWIPAWRAGAVDPGIVLRAD